LKERRARWDLLTTDTRSDRVAWAYAPLATAPKGIETGELEVAQLLQARPATDGPEPHPLRAWW